MELIDRAKQVINGYYSGEFDKLYIPEDIIGEVFDLASSTASKIDQFCIFHDDLLSDPMFRCARISARSTEKVVSQTIAVNFIKQVQQYASLADSKDALVSVTVLSNLNLEAMSEPFSFTVFDKRIAIVLESDNNGGYFLTTNQDIIDECCRWLDIPKIDEHSVSVSFLQEPLMFSADMISEVAHVLCSHDHMNMESCYWYHSVWQYLRLMNMVSTPTWHHDFYVEQLAKSIEGCDSPRVLISGAADYSSLSYAIQAVKSSGKIGHYSVLDLCQTPLFACQWYAKRENVSIETLKMSIFDLRKKNYYDIICTDAFLTRFSKEEMSSVISIWYEALAKGGSVVTTVRIHDETHTCPEVPSEDDVQVFRHKAYERSKIWGSAINYSQEQIAEMAAVYAKNMKSNSLGNKDDIINTFENLGFSIDYLADVEVQGELYPSRYLRIRATKGA